MSIGLGIGLSLLAGVFKAGKSISTKISTTTAGEYVTSWVFRTVSTILFAIGVFLTTGFSIPFTPQFWIAASFNAIALSATTLLITKAFKISDISVIAPLMALLPILVTVPAWIVLGEQPTLLAGVGIVLVVIGAYLLEVRSKSDSFTKPFTRLRTDRGAQYIGIMLIIASVVPTVDKIGISYTEPLIWVFTTHLGMTLILGVIMLKYEPTWKADIDSSWKPLLLIGGFNALLWGTQVFAYDLTQVAYVQAIKRGSIFLSIIAGYVIFDEGNIRNRFIGATVIFIGVACVVLGA